MTPRSQMRVDRVRAIDAFYGPTRAGRPSDVHGGVITCPFCPGNEEMTGPPVDGSPDADWQSRVVANRYPSVEAPAGRHEVIVETRAHDAAWARLPAAEIARILRVYRAREQAAFADGYAYAAIFKNRGASAGASLRHPHAQVFALTEIPYSIAVRIARLDETCAACDARGTAENDARLIARAGPVRLEVPFAARTSFELRIVPDAHLARFAEAPDELVEAAAVLLADGVARLAALLGEEFAFNMFVHTAARDPRALARGHWEIEVFPRVEGFGGFEIGTGAFLVNRPPEVAAAALRAALPSAARA